MRNDDTHKETPADEIRPPWFERVSALVAKIEESSESGYLPEWLTSKFGHLVHKLKAKDTTGRWAYYFVLVREDREAEFLEAIEGDGTVDLEIYGKVVASCYGETPSEEVKQYLRERYGFEV